MKILPKKSQSGPLRNIMTTFLVAVLSTFFIYGGYSLTGFAEEKYDFEVKGAGDIFTESQMLYHKGMNNYFNESIKTAIGILKDPGGASSPKLRAPTCSQKEIAEDTCFKKKCGDNVSPYCVGMEGLNRYKAYVHTLKMIQQSNARMNSPWWAEFKLLLITDLLVFQALQDTAIEEDIQKSQLVLEATVKAYNEFLMAYPVHMVYEDVIKNLIKYKKKLQAVRTEVAQFPSEFVDTTSTKCQ